MNTIDINDADGPLFEDTGADAPHKDKDVVERNAINAVVRDPETNKFLLLKWNDNDWVAFVAGGIEEGQTAEEAARAEVRQETGYTNLRLVSELPRYRALFWHSVKEVNRLAYFQNFFFELENNEKFEVSEDEKVRHKEVWLTLDELKEIKLQDGPQFLLNHIIENEL